MLALNEIILVLTEFPGNLIYYLVILSAVALALATAIRAYQTTPATKTRRVMLAMIIIFSLQILLFTLSLIAWRGSEMANRLLPLGHRILTMLSLIWLIWSLLSQKPKSWLDILASLLTLLTLIAGALAIIYWLNEPAALSFNGTWLDATWVIATFVLLLLAFAGLLAQKSHYKLEGILIIVFAVLGYLLYYFSPNAGSLPAAVLLSELLYYPLLISIAWQHANLAFINHFQDEAKYKPVESDDRVDVTPRLAESFLEIGLQNNSKKIQNAVSHAVSLFMMSDICAVMHLDQSNLQINVESAYDLIREDYLRSFKLSADQAPNLYQAFLDGKPLQLIANERYKLDIDNLYRATGYNQLGDPLIFPIKSNGKTHSIALLLMTPYTFRRWTPENLERLEKLGPSLARIIENAFEVDARIHATEGIQVTLNQVTRENTRLQEQLERSQILLGELRLEYNNNKNAYQVEIQSWVERVESLKDQISTLEDKIQAGQSIVQEAQQLKQEKQNLELQVQRANLQIDRLKLAMQKAKSVVDDIIAAQDLEDLQTPKGFKQAGLEDQEDLVVTGWQPEIHLDTIDPFELVHQSLLEVSETIAQKDLQMQLELGDLPEKIKIVKDSFTKVFSNLLSNALSASPNGAQVQVRVALGEDPAQQPFLDIQVTDQGGGLSQQEQDSFQRMIERIAHPVPGGIGDIDALREVMKHIQVLQGNFWINSDVNQPTTYRLRLPFDFDSNSKADLIADTPKEEI